MYKYQIMLYWSEEYKSYAAVVPELSGCLTYGICYEEALANAQEAIELWIDRAREFGEPIPRPKTSRLTLA
jgi:predicted RNase H-like HicB family nuclease